MNSKSNKQLPKSTNVTNAQNCVQYDSIRSPSYIVNKRSSIVYLQVAVKVHFLFAIDNIDSKAVPRILKSKKVYKK